MNHRILLLFSVFFLFVILSTSFVNAEVRVCYDCANCSNELVDSVYLELNNSISNDTATCIQNSLKENITIDCKGSSITGGSSDYGIYLQNCQNITIKNCSVDGYFNGIYLHDVSGRNLKYPNEIIEDIRR
ncbi:MAG: hypothetical protein JJE19_04520 [Methanosarcinales archaeon]|nr:hypothetical protein [Methanosarcinales archaeon]